ncbi:MAG: S46 family peptidase [Flavobacteriaceae bacterium]|jgi:hypothetical protein|nr:S46 family peptidase [Flavobacteriaceae bacterium]
MKKIFLLLVFLTSFLQMKADEGMWLLMLIKRLNGVDMQKEGLHLTPEEIYSVNSSSMKDAIVQFAGGCTAEVVSKEGLLFTNHHCGYASIAALSTPEKDYLTNGFWAMKKSDELPAKGVTVRFLVRMDDVSARINARLGNNISAEDRKKIIEEEYKAIENENSENGKYTVVVRDFFNGNEFYYFVYQDFKDVRLVGTPPSSLGKFGGDTDNWEWPRHTADFSVFRIYADANGNPAEYSESNIPLSPKHSLPISLKGYQPGDFAMILGFPGRTNRYLTSYGITQMVSKDYPAWVEASKLAMDVMKKYMDKDQATKLDYASQYAGVANYWKNRQGTIDAVYKNNTIGDKQKLEQTFGKWASTPENQADYGNVLKNIEGYYQKISERNVERNYSAQLQRNVKYIIAGYTLGNLFKTYSEQDDAGKEAMKQKVLDAIERTYDGFNENLEKEMLVKMIDLYQKKVSKRDISKTLMDVKTSDLEQMATLSIFANKASVLAFFNNPDRVLEADPIRQLAEGFVNDQKSSIEKYTEIDDRFQTDSRLFLDGLMKSQPDKKFYPDANSTMRLTYGNIDTLPQRTDRQYFGISAKDNYYTDARGVVAKYKKGDEEFDLPQKFIDLVNKKDFGRYADPKTKLLQVNFLSNNDITGGNSGSPVIDGNGRLLGLAFDGNSEALSGDIVFIEEWQRTINVDVRFVLWVIEKYGNAQNIISELNLVE